MAHWPPCGGAGALIDRALDCVSSGNDWIFGNIIAPVYAGVVVGIARRESCAICQRSNTICLYHAITGLLTTVCSFINCHFHWYHWLCSAWYIQSAIHCGIVEPYWFFEDWDLSNLSSESERGSQDSIRIKWNLADGDSTKLQPNKRFYETWKLNKPHSPSKGSNELGWCNRNQVGHWSCTVRTR